MWGDGGAAGAAGGGYFELHSAPVHPRLPAGEPVHALAFDPLEEALWAGTESGLVVQLAVGGGAAAPPGAFATYASVPAHADRVVELRALGEAAVSLSTCGVQVRRHRCAAGFSGRSGGSSVHACRDAAVLLRCCGHVQQRSASCRRPALACAHPHFSQVHASGGAPRASWEAEAGDLSSLELEPRSSRAVVGRAGGGLMLLDLKRGAPTGEVRRPQSAC